LNISEKKAHEKTKYHAVDSCSRRKYIEPDQFNLLSEHSVGERIGAPILTYNSGERPQ